MTTTTPTPEKRTDTQTDTDLDARDVRALEQYLTVLDNIGRVRDAEDLYLVVSQSGSEYLVDARAGACECPDHEYRGVHCKHLRRVAFATGERTIPAGVEHDPNLGEHIAGPRVAVADGGAVKNDEDDEDDWVDPIAMDVFGMSFEAWHAQAQRDLGIEEADR